MESALHVIVVDDQASMRSVLKKMLHQMGWFELIEEASDGEEAWSKLSSLPYDLVIADVFMPGLDGIGLLKRCRADAALRELPFLMISGDAVPEIVASAGEWGAYDYIVKPFSYSDLKKRVEQVFERMRLPEETLFREAERLKTSGRLKEALALITRQERASRNPKPRWLNLKAECLMVLGDLEDAAAHIEQALTISELFLAGYKNYAVVQQKLGNTDKAIHALEKADSLSPLDSERKMSLATLLIQSGRDEEGKEVLNRLLKQSTPDQLEANRLKVAQVYLDNGRFGEAEEIYVRTIRSNPDQVEAYNRLAIALRRQGKLAEAEKYYQLALKHSPTNPVIYYNLGVLCLNREDRYTAVKYLKKSLELDPEFREAAQVLKSIGVQAEGAD